MTAQFSRRGLIAAAAAAAGAAATQAVIWEAPAFAAAPGTLTATPAPGAASSAGSVLDTVTFGQTASEAAHGLSAEASTTVAGALGQSARVLNPLAQPGWWGGSTTFTVTV